MTTLNRIELDVLCPNCGATGELRVLDNAAPVFRVYVYPEGFSEVRSSADYRETKVRCNCGQEFYLLWHQIWPYPDQGRLKVGLRKN